MVEENVEYFMKLSKNSYFKWNVNSAKNNDTFDLNLNHVFKIKLQKAKESVCQWLWEEIWNLWEKLYRLY